MKCINQLSALVIHLLFGVLILQLRSFASLQYAWRVWQWWCISNYFRAGSILVLVMITTVVVSDMRMYAQSAYRRWNHHIMMKRVPKS